MIEIPGSDTSTRLTTRWCLEIQYRAWGAALSGWATTSQTTSGPRDFRSMVVSPTTRT